MTAREVRRAEKNWRDRARVAAETRAALEEAKLRDKEAQAAAAQAFTELRLAQMAAKHK